MTNKYIFIIIIAILALCLLWYANSQSYSTINSREYFTTQQTDLANKILTFFKSPNSYPTYVKFLVSNNNTSVNLGTLDTYNALAAKGNQLQLSDILNKF